MLWLIGVSQLKHAQMFQLRHTPVNSHTQTATTILCHLMLFTLWRVHSVRCLLCLWMKSLSPVIGVFKWVYCKCCGVCTCLFRQQQQHKNILNRGVFCCFCFSQHIYTHTVLFWNLWGKEKTKEKKKDLTERESSYSVLWSITLAMTDLLFLEAMFSCSAWHTVKDWLHYTLKSRESCTSSKKYDVVLNSHV